MDKSGNCIQAKLNGTYSTLRSGTDDFTQIADVTVLPPLFSSVFPLLPSLCLGSGECCNLRLFRGKDKAREPAASAVIMCLVTCHAMRKDAHPHRICRIEMFCYMVITRRFCGCTLSPHISLGSMCCTVWGLMSSRGAVISIFLCVESKQAQEEKNVAARIVAGAIDLRCLQARDCVTESALDQCVCVCVPGRAHGSGNCSYLNRSHAVLRPPWRRLMLHGGLSVWKSDRVRCCGLGWAWLRSAPRRQGAKATFYTRRGCHSACSQRTLI